jgi:hypothetical protein
MSAMDEDEDTTAQAYASIAAQLESWTSPKVGRLSASIMMEEEQDESSPGYEMDALEWMQRELMVEEVPLATPKRTPLLERADTPVMSNSSATKAKKLSMPSSSTRKTPEVMAPINSPLPFKNSSKLHSPRPIAVDTSDSSTSSSQYRRYHDCLLYYVRQRRSLSDRIELEQEERMLTDDSEVHSTAPSSLTAAECRVELELLKTLNQLAWSQAHNPDRRLEGNVWSLLAELRKLGLASLVWDNDRTSLAQHKSSQAMFLQRLNFAQDSTSKQVLEKLTASDAPLLLQRRHAILQWMHTCFQQQIVQPKSTILASRSHPDDQPPLMEQAQQELLRSCLSHVLAGRLEDASQLARSHGQPWRAAVWNGGAPAGYDKVPNETTKTVDNIPVGNPHRFLWKRQIWNNGQRLISTSPHEAAICSILSNDVKTSFSNPTLRTWQHGLYVALYSSWGRTQDEVLHAWNNHRREARPPFPGTQHLAKEREQLIATADLATVTEQDVMKMLETSPFEAMRGTGCYESCAASILVGKSFLIEYCELAANNIQVSGKIITSNNPEEVTRLRFLTHLLLYLDSLEACTTPIVIDGITGYKNQVLFAYVQHLASRPDLWHMVALYASFLPEQTAVDYVPTVLVQILDLQERIAMLSQIRDLLVSLELPILRQVVRLLLEEQDASDRKKCKSMQWLLQYEEHFGDALVCANMLLREFFLQEADDNKLDAAMEFVHDHLPEDLVETAGQVAPEDEPNQKLYNQKVDNARTEHMAFWEYLEAYRVFGEWKETISKASETAEVQHKAALNMSLLNPTELAIAQQRLVRDWRTNKTAESHVVIEAADETRKALLAVLKHPGGWLSPPEEYEQPPSGLDREDKTRQQEIAEIRSRYLVIAVDLYHQVCEETAFYMSHNLDDAPENKSRQQALAVLVGPDSNLEESSPLAPAYWYQHALDLASIVAMDTYGIHKAFGSLELQEFLSKLAETAVSKLMNGV